MSVAQPPAGHVRALIECKHHPALVAAAHATLAGRDPSHHIRSYSGAGSAGLIFDPDYGAVPIGRGSRVGPSHPGALHPDRSATFLVRGFVPTGTRGDTPHQIGEDLVHSDPVIGSLLAPGPLTCGDSPAVGDAGTVAERLGTQTLAAHGLDGSGVALAIVDSGIYLPRISRQLGDMTERPRPALDAANSWKSNVVTEPGFHRLGHGTMCAYDALIAAPKATLIDIALLLARPLADHTTTGTVSTAIKAYHHLLTRWQCGLIDCDALVVSNSWGIYHPSLEDFPPGHPGRFIDNPDHPFRTVVRALVQAGADVVFCGSNCGADCRSGTCLSRSDGMIMGANAYPEVLTVAGCDTNDNRVGYSARGPSIANMFEQKPDLTAYTHFLGSRSRRIFLPDTGVSAACPVAAGCVAALRTRMRPAQLPSAQLFDFLKATARAGAGGGSGGTWNSIYGYGIVNPVAAARSLGLVP